MSNDLTQAAAVERYNWPKLVETLNMLLRLKTTPIGMKLFERVEQMQAIPKVRRPAAIHTTDQIVAQAARLGFTVGITRADLVGAQCGAVIGLAPQDEEWLSGKHMAGVWFATIADSSAHQHAMDVVPHGKYQAMAVSPLASGRLDPPDICLIYATPGQMIIFINGLQWSGYKKLNWGVVGESACADSWGRALATGVAEPVHPLLCRAALRRRARRRNAHRVATAIPAQGDRRHAGPVGERPQIPDSAIRHPGRRARRQGSELSFQKVAAFAHGNSRRLDQAQRVVQPPTQSNN